MKILPKIIVLLLSIIIGILIILPSLIESKSVQISLKNKLTSKFQTNINIESDINISFLPRPKIIIKNVTINNFPLEDGHININFDSIHIIPKISSLFGSLKISKIVLNKFNANYVISYNSANKKEERKLEFIPIINEDFIANKIFNFNKSENNMFELKNISNIIVKNSILSILDISGNIYSKYTDLFIKIDADLAEGKVYADGSFFSDDVPTIFDLDISTKSDDISKLIINSPILQGDISGSFFDTKGLSLTKSNFDGKINFSVTNLKLLLDKYFSQKDLIFRNINNTEDVQISSNLFLKDGVVNIENIKINSKQIKGSGSIIAYTKEENQLIDAELSLDYLNIDDLWVGKFQPIKDNYLNEAIKNIVNNFNNISNIDEQKFPKLDVSIFGLSLKSKIAISQLKYKEQLLTDVLISMSTLNDKQIKLEKFEINVQDHSKLEIAGIIENIGSLPTLDGYLILSSKNLESIINFTPLSTKGLKENSLKDFKVRSKILILPNTTLFKDIKAVLNKETVISGNISMIENSDILDANYNLKFNQLKLENYFPTNYLDKFINGNAFLQNFLGLNNIDTSHELSLKFGKLSYDDFNLNDQLFDIKIGRGTIDIPALIINKGQNSGNIKLYLDVYSPIPILNLSINANSFNINDIINDTEEDKFKSSFLNYFFDFPSLSRFDGNIDIDIKNLNFNSLKIKDLIIKAPFTEGVMSLKEGSANIFNGKINVKGDIVLNKQKRLNNSFQLIEVENQKLFNNLFNIKNIDSKSNISGIISSYASNRNEFYNNMNLEAKFVSSGVVIKNFGIGDLLIKMNKSPQSIRSVEDVVFSNSAQTIFKKIDGSINIKPNNTKRELYISTESIGLNAITSGNIDLKNNKINIGHNAVMIVVTPDKKTLPIRFALNALGSIDNLSLSPNFSQINQYLKSQ